MDKIPSVLVVIKDAFIDYWTNLFFIKTIQFIAVKYKLIDKQPFY